MSRRKIERQATFEFISVVWQDQAVCQSVGTEVFFYDRWENHPEELEFVRNVCSSCPVQADCVDYALKTDQHYGIWGGLTPDERRQIRRRMARSA